MSTEASFDHLDVINSVLSLAFNLESYPNHLYKAGYHISRIEPQFNVNGTLNPDIFFIFNTLMARSVSQRTAFTSRELTEESLGEIWDHLDKDLQKSLNGKIRRFLKHCKSHELKDYLSNREDAWTIEINEHWKSRKKFSDDCNLLMRNLSQKILFDYGFEEENE